MGYGGYSSVTADEALKRRKSTGSTFKYSDSVKSSGRSNYKAHENLDVKDRKVTESRDSKEHPNSVPIVTVFDETGSMGSVPRTAQEKLSKLFGLLLKKGYVEDPQIMIGAYGDAYTDSVPIQMSQFESDNRIDENLNNLFLEGYGGGNNGETISLAWYYLAHHTATDSFEKRNKKGYAYFIADERALDITPEQVKKFIGDGQPLGGLTNKEIVADLTKKWKVKMLVINNHASQYQNSVKQYEDLFGKENVIIVENPDTMVETIGLSIGFEEGTLDSLKQAEKDLKDVGMDIAVLDTMKNQLKSVNTDNAVVTQVEELDL